MYFGSRFAQAKRFLAVFHAQRLTQSAKLVEEEQWAQVEVSSRSQRIVNVLVEAAVADAVELIFVKPTTANSDPNGATNGNTPSATISPPPSAPSASINGTATGNAKYLNIEDRTYYVVSATMQVLQMVIDYLKVIVNMGMLTMECMSRLVEFLKVSIPEYSLTFSDGHGPGI